MSKKMTTERIWFYIEKCTKNGNIEGVKKLVKGLIESKCKEQLEIAANLLNGEEGTSFAQLIIAIKELICNAPLPKI